MNINFQFLLWMTVAKQSFRKALFIFAYKFEGFLLNPSFSVISLTCSFIRTNWKFCRVFVNIFANLKPIPAICLIYWIKFMFAKCLTSRIQRSKNCTKLMRFSHSAFLLVRRPTSSIDSTQNSILYWKFYLMIYIPSYRR